LDPKLDGKCFPGALFFNNNISFSNPILETQTVSNAVALIFSGYLDKKSIVLEETDKQVFRFLNIFFLNFKV